MLKKKTPKKTHNFFPFFIIYVKLQSYLYDLLREKILNFLTEINFLKINYLKIKTIEIKIERSQGSEANICRPCFDGNLEAIFRKDLVGIHIMSHIFHPFSSLSFFSFPGYYPIGIGFFPWQFK